MAAVAAAPGPPAAAAPAPPPAAAAPLSVPGGAWPAIGPPPLPAASARDRSAYYIDLFEKFSPFEERKNAAIERFKQDPGNIATAGGRVAALVARGPRVRLPAEVIRDQLPQVVG